MLSPNLRSEIRFENLSEKASTGQAEQLLLAVVVSQSCLAPSAGGGRAVATSFTDPGRP